MKMFRILSILLVLAISGCDREAPPVNVASATEAGLEVRFPVQVGSCATKLRVAATELEKSQGLMGVAQLSDGEGMAFMYVAPQRMNFWMKDTLLNLDIAFVRGDGTIDEIRTMEAGDTRDTYSRSDQVSFTIEMSAGWFARSGVKSGDKVNLSDLKKALSARGFISDRYLK